MKALRWTALVLVTISCLMLPSIIGRAAPMSRPFLDAGRPAQPVKLVFIHHSVGENWLADDDGGLGVALRNNNYFVSDTNYGWGPPDADVGYDAIGDHTDIGHWYNWFAGPHRNTYLSALYAASDQHSSYSRLANDPGGPNEIIMFKSCFFSSHLGGSPSDPPTVGPNPLRGQDYESEYHTIGNAKGIYNDILAYFATRQDKLFVVIAAPPRVPNDTDGAHAANARAFNDWLVNDWLAGYPYTNVAVFDFYNVLTSNGGATNVNDLGSPTGNHHRWWNNGIQHVQTLARNTSAYGSSADDSHPTSAGNRKATGEFISLLNVFYNRWRGSQAAPTATATPSAKSTATRTRTGQPTRTPTTTRAASTVTSTATASLTATRARTPTPTRTASVPTVTPTSRHNTWYVRPDGGSAQQCTGRANAPYPGGGENQPCAWDHPFRALPPGGALRIGGGDTLIIGAGSYMMGYGAPGADNCDAGGSFDCHMPPIPSGPGPADRTRILGDSAAPNLPELWGAERPWLILNLADSNNVEIGYLEITDHSSCVEFHSGGLGCERDNPPYGPWASAGLYAEDSANVYLHHLNIHGLADRGVLAGRLTDWTVEDVRVAGNGSAGWDGDLWDDDGDSNSGTLIFRRWTVEWNGCGETYPGEQPTGCWAQSAGGYGDGFATGTSGGHWVVEDSIIRRNTSDGLDFLYVSEPGSSIEIRRTIVEGNAGNQIKNYRGPFLLENSIIVGNCGFFDGQPFTYNVDNCRALGTALAIGLSTGDQATVINNTFTSEGDCLVTAEAYGTPNGSERVHLRNNIFVGQTDFLQPFESTCLVYEEQFPADPFDIDYSLTTDVKDDLCPGPHDICGASPGLENTSIDAFDGRLVPGSPAIDAGIDTGIGRDYRGVARPQGAAYDIGAYEFVSSPPVLRPRHYLPLLRR